MCGTEQFAFTRTVNQNILGGTAEGPVKARKGAAFRPRNARQPPAQDPWGARLNYNASALAVIVWRLLPGWARTALTWCFNAHFVVGTVAIIQDNDDRVLLARHTYRPASPWALPGGWVRRGENPGGTIVREIAEETGLTVKVLGPLTVQQEGPRHLTIVYAARVTGGAFRSSAEVSEARFVASKDWPVGLRDDHKGLIEQFAIRRTTGRA